MREFEAEPPTGWNALALAFAHAVLGNPDEAFRWLDHEPAHAWAVVAAAYPQFDRYRDDPRFQSLLRTMNLRRGPADPHPIPLPVAGAAPTAQAGL